MRRVADTAPPEAFFAVSAVFHYLGPSFAVLLFARVDVLGVAWLRIATAALVFAAWRRPWRRLRTLDPDGRRRLLAWGAVLAVMNSCFYLAIDRLPLGTVAAIEFLPVIALAALGARTGRNAAALGLAVTGVALLTEVKLAGAPLGFALAFANAGLFAAYIVLSARAAGAGAGAGIDALGAAMLVAALVATPIGAWAAAPAFAHPLALLAGAGVGISSSVVPYVTDQLALARIPRATYALLVALLPATATVIGIVVLAQLPGAAELAGVALVGAGVALHRDSDARAEPGSGRVPAMGIIKGEKSVEIEAPVARCFDIAADIEHAPVWQGSLKDVDVLSRDAEGRAEVVNTKSDAKVKTVSTRLRFAYHPPDRIAWTQEKGDVKSLEGWWTLEDLGDGRTRATYGLAVDPGRMLGMLLKGPAEAAVRDFLLGGAADGLKQHAEAASRAG